LTGLEGDLENIVVEIEADGGNRERETSLGLAAEEGYNGKGRLPRKKNSKGRGTRNDVSPESDLEKDSISAKAARSLKLRVPPLSSLVSANLSLDPDEPKYCYCNQVSFGEVSVSHNSAFHLGL
jgi:hypothetical protein